MNNQKKIIFMGTAQFAIPCLDNIKKNKFNLIAVVTSPDKPAGRGLKISESPVKEYAKKNQLNLLQPVNLKDSNFINQIRRLKPDLIVVVAFRMLPEILWSIPTFGSINVHASLLPNYRGAAPINWAIINGEKQTGVTTFFINDRIDTGDVIGQSKIDINKNENAGELHNSLMRLGADLLIKSIDKIFSSKENISTKQLEVKNLKAAPKLNKTNCKINWQDSCINIHNKIRGLSPYPGARSVLDNLNKKIKVIIYKSDYIKEAHNLNSGSIYIEKDKIKIAVVDGYIYPLLIKFEGKKTMDTKSLINGFNFNKECKMI
ncbi:MAG: methionyl-tRNA formyltransferase [Bacteroidota bacterium]|nr:methionyl-tRNA formyltransferase [Bacteroidota bacterium]MEC9107943.1 methionyl-tRNA formyltransferase [Bacteroidota bacterium]